MRKAASIIVRFRSVLAALTLLMCVPAALNIRNTGINYDLAAYLAKDTMTRRGLEIMEAEFENTASLNVVLSDADEETALMWAERIAGIGGVMTATHDPVEGVRTEGGREMRLISVISSEAAAESVYDETERLLSGEEHLVSGAVRDNRLIRRSLDEEIPVVMAVSCGIVLLVLLLMSKSLMEPFLFFICIAVSITLNMGTNSVFGSVSFITFAVAAILQLALAMDYSIMLINAYDRMLEEGCDVAEAMTEALAASFLPVSSSALTTVAGMISLVFMSFTIGFDIGMVLAKGIVISMLTVFLMLPGALTLFTPWMRKTAHKPLRLKGAGLCAVVRKSRGAVSAALILLIAAGAVIQTGNTYTYTVRDMDGDSAEISRLFGYSNPLALLFPVCRTDADYEEQAEMLREMQAIEAEGRGAVSGVYAMPVTAKPALEYYDAAAAAEMMGADRSLGETFFRVLGIEGRVRGDELMRKAADFMKSAAGLFVPAAARQSAGEMAARLEEAERTFNGEKWSRAILSLDLNYMDPDTPGALKKIREIMTAHYGDMWAMTGGIIATDDIGTTFSGDVRRVSLITVAAVFLIILLSFGNAVIPPALVCVIQGAIWINMAFSGLVDGSVFFMCYLICMALQMGATIDYGILLTENYRFCRRTLDPEDAAAEALDRSMQTIMTSGLALITAGFAVGRISSVFYISSIGTMLGRGAVVSALLVLLLLPRILVRLDKWIVRTGSRKRKTAE